MRFRPQEGYGQLAWALSGSTVQDETSTASNADAGTDFSWSSRAFRHRRSRVPWKYQSEPLSARISPYRFIARSTTRALGLNPDRSNPAFRRNRAPMGGHRWSDVPASCRAGHRCRFSVHCAVNRIAWPIAPALTSSNRTRPGRMGRPAASAEVHPSGRSALDDRSKTAPLPAVGFPWFQSASNSSYSVQVLLFTMIAWRSDPFSIGVLGPNGYRTRSLSLAYWNLILTVRWRIDTTSYGSPELGGPKSGWRFVEPACIDA